MRGEKQRGIDLLVAVVGNFLLTLTSTFFGAPSKKLHKKHGVVSQILVFWSVM